MPSKEKKGEENNNKELTVKEFLVENSHSHNSPNETEVTEMIGVDC
jgi:hypothetical protein